MNNIPAYKTELILNDRKVQYLFESKGEVLIIKAIEYSPFTKKDGRTIYNLGFGDYDLENGTILDDTNSNNGDMRKVFSTVLNTIPHFFKNHKDVAIWVQGSDSTEEFKKECKKTCTKDCKGQCKNFNRRIRTYRYYINKNFKELIKEYVIFGYTNEEKPILVQYIPKSDYIGIMIFKKK